MTDYANYLNNIERVKVPPKLKETTNIDWDIFGFPETDKGIHVNDSMNYYSSKIIHVALLWIANGFNRTQIASFASTAYYKLVHNPYSDQGASDSEPMWQSKDLIRKFIDPEWS